jgi:hypothetical protein
MSENYLFTVIIVNEFYERIDGNHRFDVIEELERKSKYLNYGGTYKFLFKLPSDSVIEFDFYFEKGENYEIALKHNFEQESIPKIIIPSLTNILNQFLLEERKNKKSLTCEMKENLISKLTEGMVKPFIPDFKAKPQIIESIPDNTILPLNENKVFEIREFKKKKDL